MHVTEYSFKVFLIIVVIVWDLIFYVMNKYVSSKKFILNELKSLEFVLETK